MLLATVAAAQQCTYEIEPNETPAEATLIRAPDTSGAFNAPNARMPVICLAGEISSSNQDAFWWDVDEVAAQHNWTLSIDGVRGVNQLSLYRIDFAPNGVDVTAADELMRFVTPNGSPHVSKNFLIEPGRYLIGISVAGAEGPYVVNLTPQSNSRLGGTFSRSTYRGEFRSYGSVEDVQELTFEVQDDDAGFTWGLDLRSAIGTSPRLELEGPSGLIGEPVTVSDGVARYDGYALPPGTYTVRVVGSTGTAVVGLSKQGRQGDGQEVEPNNGPENATVFPLGSEMRGRSGDQDWFRTLVSEQDAARAWDLQVQAETDIDVRLQHPDGSELLSRRFAAGTVERLGLEPGAYYLNVRRVRDDADYRLTWSQAAAAPAGMNEREPNDTLATATDLGAQPEARGLLQPQDTDYFRFEVEGEAQLYRVQAVGQGVTRLSIYGGGGVRNSRVDGKGRLRLDDLLLLPGSHYMAVEGEGEYALRAIPLGPAPAPEPPAAMPDAAEPLRAADTGPSEPAPDEPITGPPVVEEPALPAPPPGLLEYEPNNDGSRAHRLQPGAVHVGRIAGVNDEDHYRFHLSADQYVRLELVPPEGKGNLSFDLSGEGRFRPLPGEDGQPVVMERWLLAGDHSLYVHSRPWAEAPSGYYQLRLTLLGVLELPVDREPNDSSATAATMPMELEWEGSLGEAGDNDMYAFPVFEQDTEAQVKVSGGSITPRLRLEEGSSSARQGEDGWYSMTLPAGQRTYLDLTGAGRYQVNVEFSHAPDPAQLLPPRHGDALSVTLDAPVSELAAFWHEGQRVEATITLRNDSSERQSVNLSAAVNDVRSRAELPSDVEVGPGETVQVPVTLEVPAGAREDVPLYLQVAASSALGSASARTDFQLRCETEPVAPFPYHSLPTALLGKPNVLWSGFGATLHGESPYVGRDMTLIDGRTAISTGGFLDQNHSPTYLLAGEEPVTLVGTSLHPQAGSDRRDQLRAFRIETSLDGSNFTPVFEGTLQAARVEQAFEFDEPVSARYARLVLIDSIQGSSSRAYVGEWKLYAEDPGLFSGRNIANWEVGGHMVWSDPLIRDRYSITDATVRASRLFVRDLDEITFVLGFRDSRAALIDELTWHESEEGQKSVTEMASTVLVEASLSGAAGPWEHVAEWQLERDAAGTARLSLPDPVWARYLRFTVPVGNTDYLYGPQALGVYEAAVGTDGYLSVLGGWGNMTNRSAYELLMGEEGTSRTQRSLGNHSRETALALESGVPVTGSVAIGENVDWYKITTGPDQNHVELHLAGDPTIAYTYEVTDSSGRPVAYEERADGDGRVLTFFAEPGDHYLKLEEPKRSVVFSWDTSGSVSPYIPITYNSLAEFGRGVDGEREAVQLLAYNNPVPTWLLPYWSSDPLRVQRSIQEYDRSADSSDTEIALLTATKALEDREGTRAVLLITDAESGGYSLTPDLWRALEQVRPRVFTFEISSGGSNTSQDMMQDYASVNGGYYDMAGGVGDFDAGFARASCILRRPKAYEVQVAASYVTPPGPGMLSVVPAPGAAQAAVEVIFDASGSMGQLLPSGEQRIVAAKRALEALVGEVLPDGTPFALRAFGHISPTSCETRLDVAFGALDRDKAMAAVRAIEPKLLSGTPIAESLAAVAQDLSGAGGGRQVILITDGEESCGGDPAAAVRQLREGGPLSLAIVSLALEPEALAVFEALAEEVGASFVDVGSYEALSTAITEALNPAFEVYDLEGELVAEGRVGGEAVELPMGLYRVRVLSMPVEVIENVRVPGDGSVTVNAGQ